MSIFANIIAEFNPRGIDEADGAFKQFGQTVSGALSTGLIVNFARTSITAAADLSETMNKAGVIFGDAADEVINFADSAVQNLGQSRQTAIDAASTFAQFGKAAGLAGTDLVSFSTDFVTLAADLASFNNTTPEEAIFAIGAALRGEAEPLRRYGVLLDDATLKAAAMEMGIYNGSGALTQQQKVLAAQKVIMEQTGAAQGDFARTSDGLANQQRILQASIEEVQVAIGEALVPAVQSVIGVITPMLDLFNRMPNTMRDFVSVTAIAGGMAKSLSTTLQGLKVSANVANASMGILAVAMIGYSLATKDAQEDSARYTEALGNLTRASDAELEAVLAQTVATRIWTDQSMTASDILTDIAQNSYGTAERIVELGIATEVLGLTQEEATAILEREVAAQQQAQSDINATTEAVNEQSVSLEDQAKAAEEAEKALKRLLDATLAMFSSQMSLEESTWATQDAIAEFENIVKSVTTGTYEGEDAFRDYAEAENAALQAALDQAEAASNLAEQQAASTGATLTAAQAAIIQRDELQKVANALDPSSPLRRQLDDYIETLNTRIPQNIRTNLEANVNITTSGGGAGKLTFRAAGGSVSTGSPYIVGEDGPELFTPYSDGQIISNPDMLRMASASSISGGGRGSSTMVGSITVNMPAGSNGDDVVRSLKRWVDQNGPIPIATTTSKRG